MEDSNALLSFIIPLVLMFAIFYFLLIRPQQKRNKQRNEMMQALKAGDKVVTIGGIHGTIVEINDDKVNLKVSENVRMTVDRAAVNEVRD